MLTEIHDMVTANSTVINNYIYNHKNWKN